MPRLKSVCVIPARMGSTRFPGKPLAPILGVPMIEFVYRRCAMCPGLEDVYIATCDGEIREATEAFGGKVVMTSPDHERASDRVAEAACNLDADVVVMVQGDEPMIQPSMIAEALAPLADEPDVVCVNLAAEIEDEDEFLSPNTIKVVVDGRGNAMYMSREPIPTTGLKSFAGVPTLKQVCVIPFRRDFLETYARLPVGPLEAAESIDMLRAMEAGYRIRMVRTETRTHAVDTPDDIVLVEQLLRAESAEGLGAGSAG